MRRRLWCGSRAGVRQQFAPQGGSTRSDERLSIPHHDGDAAGQRACHEVFGTWQGEATAGVTSLAVIRRSAFSRRSVKNTTPSRSGRSHLEKAPRSHAPRIGGNRRVDERDTRLDGRRGYRRLPEATTAPPGQQNGAISTRTPCFHPFPFPSDLPPAWRFGESDVSAAQRTSARCRRRGLLSRRPAAVSLANPREPWSSSGGSRARAGYS